MIAASSNLEPIAERHHGLSRIEVLTLVLILTLSAGFLLSGVQRIRESAARMSCANNLKQIGVGLNCYEDTMGRLPPLVDLGDDAPSGEGIVSVFYKLRPFLESISSLYRPKDSPTSNYHGHSSISLTFRGKDNETYTHNGGDVNQVWKIFICPTDPTAEKLRDVPMTLPNGTTGYYATGNYPANGLLPWGTGSIEKVLPGERSQTIVFAERPQICRTTEGDAIYNLWGVGFYSPHMPASAALAPSGSPDSWTTGQIAPVFSPLDEPIRVRLGRADAAPIPPDFEYPFQRIVEGRACDPRLPGSPHRAGMQAAMADGSVRLYSYDTTHGVFWAACQPGASVSGGSRSRNP